MERKETDLSLTEFLATLDISERDMVVLITHISCFSSASYKNGFTKALELSTGLSKDDERSIKMVKDYASIDIVAMVDTMLEIVKNIKEGESNDARERWFVWAGITGERET